jgi:hypothetical protein
MNRQTCKALISLVVLLLSACAYLNNTLDDVKIGMDREHAIRSVPQGRPEFTLGQGTTEYLLYRVGASFFSLYSDYPWSVLFVRLENGTVVDKGVVGFLEERRIKRINSTFNLRDLEKR